MTDILLTEEELRLVRLRLGNDFGDEEMEDKAITQEQVRRVTEWLDEQCMEHHHLGYTQRASCYQCRQELYRAAGIEEPE